MGDVGPDIIAWLYDSMYIDDEWSMRDDRGFQWLPWRLAQSVGVTEPLPQDRERIRLYAETTVCRDVDDSPAIDVTLQRAARSWTVGPLLYDADDGSVFFYSSLIRDREERNSIVERWFSIVAVIQAIGAHDTAHQLAQETGGEVAEASHPSSGGRTERDDMLNLLPLPESSEENSCLTGHLSDVLEAVPSVAGQWIMSVGGGVDGRQLAAEVPFTGPRTSIDPGPHALQSSLLRVFANDPHPILGTGVAVQLLLPVSLGMQEGYAAAQRLCELEVTTLPPQQTWGTWSYDERQDSVEHLTFLPEVILTLLEPDARHQFASNLLTTAVPRSLWAAEQLGFEWSE